MIELEILAIYCTSAILHFKKLHEMVFHNLENSIVNEIKSI